MVQGLRFVLHNSDVRSRDSGIRVEHLFRVQYIKV
jgi:hypothetical protein